MKQAKTRMIDSGTLSPKVSVPTGILVSVGAVLAILDQAGVLAVDDTLWLALLSAGGVTGVSGYGARPGAVIPDPQAPTGPYIQSERGYGLVEALVVIFLLLVILIVLFRLV